MHKLCSHELKSTTVDLKKKYFLYVIAQGLNISSFDTTVDEWDYLKNPSQELKLERPPFLRFNLVK